MEWPRLVARTASARSTESVRQAEPGHSMSFTLLRAATTEPRVRLDGWFCAVRACMVRRPLVALTEAELFSSSARGLLASGISERFMRLTANRTGVFRTARSSSLAQAKSTEPLITAGPKGLARVSQCPPRAQPTGE